MFFTQEDYRKIEKWLTAKSRKDTDFVGAATPLKGNETVVLVQDGKNVKTSVKDIVDQFFLLGVSDFLNITDKYGESYISLNQAVQLIPFRSRKIGQVITFIDESGNWAIYQFQGKALNQWNNITLWIDLLAKLSGTPIIDSEDITTKENGAKQVSLYLADKQYNEADYSGLGKIYLRKSIYTVVDPSTDKVINVNLLTQSMLDKENTIYILQYDYNLNGNTVTIPEGCILDMRGGSVTNGTINCVDTIIISTDASKLDVTLTGTYRFDSEKLVTSNTEDINISQSVDRKSHTISAMLADRDTTNGMGYVILRKGKTFAEQVTQENTIYEIRYDFDVGSDFVLDGVNNITLFLNGGNLILSENNIKFNDIDGLHIVALHGEKIIAKEGYSYIPPQGETWNGIVELYGCKNVSIKGVEFVYNNVLANFIYAEDCEDAIYDGNKFSGLTSSSDMPLLPKKCIFSIGGIRTNYTNNIITDVRGGFTIGNYRKVEKNVVFSNNIVKNTILSGVNCYAKNASFFGNAFEGVGFGGNVTAIAVCGYGGKVESDSISITGNAFIDCYDAIQSDTQNGGHIHNIDVCGNTMNNCNRAVYMACSDNILVSGNVMVGSSVICIDCSDVQHAIISSNIINGEYSSSPSNPTYGIRVLPIAANAKDCEDIAIINNKIKKNDRGIYVGYSDDSSHAYISKKIVLSGNEVANCGTGLLVVPATEKLYLSNNQFVDNTTDVDIRTNNFELDGNNYFNSVGSQTNLLHNLDTSSEYPVVNYENGVYVLSSDSAYVLRGFTAPSSVTRVMIYVLSENITIAQGSINTITGVSLNPLKYSCVLFRRDGGSWIQISSEGFLKVVSEVSSFDTSRSTGLVLYNSSLKKPVVCAGYNRWVLMDGYSAVSRSGSSRPTNLIAADAGMMFFDTTAGKPIWWTGTKWVDATGATV